MKKLISILLALVLALGIASAETPFGTLFDAAKELAFDTHNVTLSAEATFSYDGEVFKVMHAQYQQDDTRSFLSYMLDTPDIYGKVTTNGYVVLGLGTRSYAGDKKFGYYYENGTKVSDTILTTNNRIEAQLKLARLLALSVEDQVAEKQEGNTYTFSTERLPELVSNAMYFLLLDYVQDNYYTDLFGLYDYTTKKASVYTEDWAGLVQKQYQALYQEEMPALEEIYEDETLYGRYSVAVNAANQAENEAANEYDSGVVLIKADGTTEWFDSEESYKLSIGSVDVYYADWAAVVKNYYKLTYGEEITDETLDYVLYSPNPVLSEAYSAFMDGMYKYYEDAAKAQDPDALSAVVLSDGSVKVHKYIIDTYESTWMRILNNMAFAEISALDATVTTDDAGRLTGLSGTMTIEITDKKDAVHEMKVEFDCKAANYDTTVVPTSFDPNAYGLISYEEYEKKLMNEYEFDEGEFDDFWQTILQNDPGTVKFAGTDYETMMEMYADIEDY